jgi:hypothetical protein
MANRPVKYYKKAWRVAPKVKFLGNSYKRVESTAKKN